MIAVLGEEDGVLLLLEIVDVSIILLASCDFGAAPPAAAENLIRTDACKVDRRRSSRDHFR